METKDKILNNVLMPLILTAAFICLQLDLFGVKFPSKWLLMTLGFVLFPEFINIKG
jgi:hypothetical protein